MVSSWWLRFSVILMKFELCFCDQQGHEVNPEFWKDMVAAIDHNYNTSAFKGTHFHPSLPVFLTGSSVKKNKRHMMHRFFFKLDPLFCVLVRKWYTTHPMGHIRLEKKKCSLNFSFCVLLSTVLVNMC